MVGGGAASAGSERTYFWALPFKPNRNAQSGAHQGLRERLHPPPQSVRPRRDRPLAFDFSQEAISVEGKTKMSTHMCESITDKKMKIPIYLCEIPCLTNSATRYTNSATRYVTHRRIDCMLKNGSQATMRTYRTYANDFQVPPSTYPQLLTAISAQRT